MKRSHSNNTLHKKQLVNTANQNKMVQKLVSSVNVLFPMKTICAKWIQVKSNVTKYNNITMDNNFGCNPAQR